MDNLPVEYLPFWKQWNIIEGKTNLREFWIPILINIVISILLGAIGAVLGTNLLASLFSLAILVPSITIAVRRLHDCGRTGLYLLWFLLPLIGWIIVIIALVQPSK